MPIKFEPNYTITPEITKSLMQIEASKELAKLLPLTPLVLSGLRETAKLVSTHYSTMIEGNQLSPEEVKRVIQHNEHFPGRKRDEKEVLGYYAALEKLEQYVAQGAPVSERVIQTLHAISMNNGSNRVKPTEYREGQNVIKDGQTNTVIYLPPEAKDVSKLMKSLMEWVKANEDLPCPIVAAIGHYQLATIHPFWDGNGRTARLLTTLILHLGGYGLKGIYSLEEYYAKNLLDYYRALTVGPSHNYYLGRAGADITCWVEYFCKGMAHSFEKAVSHMQKAKSSGKKDLSPVLKKLDPKQRKVLDLFKSYEIVTNKQIGEFFGFKPRTSSKLCSDWVQDGFLEVVDPARKSRKYALAEVYKALLEG